jgi:hypothetical protein
MMIDRRERRLFDRRECECIERRLGRDRTVGNAREQIANALASHATADSSSPVASLSCTAR